MGVDLVPDAHRGQDGPVHMAPEVDREPTLTQVGRLLDDGDAGAVPGEVRREGGPGDAGAGDEDVEVGRRSRTAESGRSRALAYSKKPAHREVDRLSASEPAVAAR